MVDDRGMELEGLAADRAVLGGRTSQFICRR